MCCDGTLFRNVDLDSTDDRIKLIPCTIVGDSFAQPCTALKPNGKCVVYEHRPRSCRTFRCRMLNDYEGGRITHEQALDMIAAERTRN